MEWSRRMNFQFHSQEKGEKGHGKEYKCGHTWKGGSPSLLYSLSLLMESMRRRRWRCVYHQPIHT